jgi:hypothetical protein
MLDGAGGAAADTAGIAASSITAAGATARHL